MCTVTLLPFPGDPLGFILTSNRDEEVQRKTFPPQVTLEGGVEMLYPRDARAGGTWIGVSERKRAVCLLNGGFEKHIRREVYRKSRGLVVLDFLAAVDIDELEHYHLKGIEPFTCILVEWEKNLQFYELVWDGQSKHLRKLPLAPHIWASAFLFSPESRRNRARAFEEFVKKQQVTPDEILRFHSSEGGEKEGLIIDEGCLKTSSITQIVKTSVAVRMHYRDLLTEGKPITIIEAEF